MGKWVAVSSRIHDNEDGWCGFACDEGAAKRIADRHNAQVEPVVLGNVCPKCGVVEDTRPPVGAEAFRDAVIEALMVAGIYQASDEGDPKGALNRLIVHEAGVKAYLAAERKGEG